MHLNGRDYVFQKANGEAEWWRRKFAAKEKRKSENQRFVYEEKMLTILFDQYILSSL